MADVERPRPLSGRSFLQLLMAAIGMVLFVYVAASCSCRIPLPSSDCSTCGELADSPGQAGASLAQRSLPWPQWSKGPVSSRENWAGSQLSI